MPRSSRSVVTSVSLVTPLPPEPACRASGEPHSGRRQAAVDEQDVAGYEARILTAEKCRRAGHLCGPARPPERHGADIAVAIVGVVGEPIGRRGRLDEPGRTAFPRI